MAPDSPVLLVATHSDERIPDLNYQLYKNAYPQIVGAMSVSNKERTEIETLKKTIAQHAATLPLMGQPWPTNWVEVEKALMARKAPIHCAQTPFTGRPPPRFLRSRTHPPQEAGR
ncbi:MAG: hypothetical protein H0U76_09405 [Ktedonobacteraceae bacterium]|nr:hypothetical protein [Ktedonobacteraceae bacterium]